jgi:hypothetical protein
LAVATDAAVVATLRVAAYLEASVRADERAQGAEAAREEGVARTRLEEAFIFRERARAAEADRAIWLDALSVTWADWATAPGVFEPPVAREPARLDIRPLYRAAASRAGMVISKLSLPQPEPAEARQGPTAILEAVSSAKKLARSSEVFFRDAPSTLAGDFVARRREPALPEGYQQGVIAREEGDLERAESLLIGAANAGSTDAMYELGSIAMLREDLTGARKWFRRAMDLTRAELRRPAHRVMTLKIEPSIEQEERERLRPELPETKDED